jgi:hypothetical protein
MSTIVIDAGLRAKLLAVKEIAELRDESGSLVGQFIPACISNSNDLDETIGISQDELQRRLSADCKTYTTAEVLAHLRGLK